jgi:hypothetical protein
MLRLTLVGIDSTHQGNGKPQLGMLRCVLVPSVRPAVRVRALRADARGGRDGTTLGRIAHGDQFFGGPQSAPVQLTSITAHSGVARAVRPGPTAAWRARKKAHCVW